MPTQLLFGPNTLYSEDEVDAFGRARVSTPSRVGDSIFQYNLNPLLIFAVPTGGATITKTTNESSVTLQCGTGATDSATLQTREYLRYQPGKSQLITMTGVIGAPKANVVSEIGYFDNNDGVFFRQDNGMNVVIRSSTSGSPIDTVIPQALWNCDRMDGSGPSSLTIDFTKTQLFIIDFQWLGEGRVRFGLNVLGRIYYLHQAVFTNVLTGPYMNTGSLPARWRIHNTGVAASPTVLKAICYNVSSEAGLEIRPGLPFSCNTGVTKVSVTSRRPVLSIQLHPTYSGTVNRGIAVMNSVELGTSSGAAFWELVLNGVLVGSSFLPIDGNSFMDTDMSATAISGGTILLSGFASESVDLTKLYGLSSSFDGTVGDILSVVMTSFSGTAKVSSSLNWDEVR